MGLLPTTKRRVRTEINAYSMLIYGPPKTGKSTFCSQIPDALFLTTEPGVNALEVYAVDVADWKTFQNVAKELAAGNHRFKTIVIDTIDNLVSSCASYVCERAKIDHESDLSMGKGHSLVRAEFERAMRKFLMLPHGVVFLSHLTSQELKGKDGKVRTKAVPTLHSVNRRVYDFINGIVDFIFVATQTGQGPDARLVLKTKPSPDYDAGDRTGHLPAVIPMTYADVKAAFDIAIAKKVSLQPSQQQPAAQPEPAPQKVPPSHAEVVQLLATLGGKSEAKQHELLRMASNDQAITIDSLAACPEASLLAVRQVLQAMIPAHNLKQRIWAFAAKDKDKAQTTLNSLIGANGTPVLLASIPQQLPTWITEMTNRLDVLEAEAKAAEASK